MKYLSLTFLLLASLTLMPKNASAQALQSLSGQQSAVSFQLSPARPGPNQQVNVSIESYSTNLDRADISWFLNNTLSQEAVGLKSFSLKTGRAGSVSNILIVIKTEDGTMLQQTINIHPASLQLVWEAQSYTPPFYRGKALYPFQGTVKVVALPNIVTENGGTLDPKKLVYTWKVDGNTVASASGYGRQYILFTGSIPIKPGNIEVEATSLDQVFVASGKTTLVAGSPQLLFYEDSPVYGVLYNKAIDGSKTLTNEEIKIVGIPYFIGAKERLGSGLSYDWQLNGEKISNGDKDSLAFRQEKGVAGTAEVYLQVSHPANIFQFANNSVSLSFGQTTGSNLFGTQ